jgi:hypothetical protein
MGSVGPHLDGGVDQLVIGFCNPPIGLLEQGYKGLPAFGQLELKPMGLPPFPFDLHGNGCQGQEAMVRREMAGPHAELGGDQLVVNLEGLKAWKPNLPARRTDPAVF